MAKVAKSSKRSSGRARALGRGSKPGEHRGGRQKGTPNKATVVLREEIAKFLGAHKLDRPVIELMKVGYGLTKWPVVVDKKVKHLPASPELRVVCLKEAAQYDGAKLSAVQMLDEDGEPTAAPAMIAAETYVRALEQALRKEG